VLGKASWIARRRFGKRRLHLGGGALHRRLAREVRSREIDCTRLKLLLEGIEPRRRHRRYQREAARQGCSQCPTGNTEGRA